MLQDKEFLFEYLKANSPVSKEVEGQKIWHKYINKYVDKTYIDTYGSCVGIINPEAKFKIVIEAHADEISWYVNYITKDGYIYVIRNGGSDYQIAPSMKAKIHTEKGAITAVFGWPAIHVRDPKKPLHPDVNNVILDCGCSSKKEVMDLGIDIGSIVTFDSDIFELNNGFISGRAFDNRIGGYMIAQVAKKIFTEKVKVPYCLNIVNSVQEEVGLNGAGMMANHIKPNVAIVTDVTHDTQSPLYNKKKDGDISCRKGPVVTYAPSVHRKILQNILKVAEDKKIPYQKSASSRYTGTDTDAFAYSNSGIASALISLPLKYMHTTVETVHETDIINTINLMYEFIKNYDSNESLTYF